MTFDIKQFLQTFIDESIELLQGTEQTLLDLNVDMPDKEAINRIFRCVHSIKSSSAVFGFHQISELTHTLETFLEEVRSGSKKLTQEEIDLLLQTVDCIRGLLKDIQAQKPLNEKLATELTEIFKEKIVAQKKTGKKATILPQKKPAVEVEKFEEKILPTAQIKTHYEWKIIFHPHRHLLQAGIEPARLFSVLSGLGQLEVETDVSEVPYLADINPRNCYLIWYLKLSGDVTKKEIQEIFKWVTNEENVTIISDYFGPESKAKPVITTAGEAIHFGAKTTSVRVTIDKIDSLINIVGELVIIKSMLHQIIEGFRMERLGQLYEGLDYLDRNFRELQANVMRIRMVPIEFVFNRVPRFVHDMAEKLGKEVELVIKGEQTELDKNMLEKLNDPLVHLIRNALDHGIELPAQRVTKGKSPRGMIELDATQEGSNIVVSVSDDGAGLNKVSIRAKAIELGLMQEGDELTDEKMYQFIFQPGFSTVTAVSDVSGRGVGLDVVYRNIHALAGEISIESAENKGTIFRLRLPLTMAIMDCQLVKIGEQIYIIPLMTISEIFRVDPTNVNYIDQNSTLYFFRGNYIPIIFLNQIFAIPANTSELKDKFMIVVEVMDQLIGFVVDELLAQQQVVIKNLEENYDKIPGIAGVTILGDGSVALIVDVKETIDLALNPKRMAEKKQDALQQKLELEASEVEPEMLPKTSLQFLTFMMGGQEYGINILNVKEIQMWQPATLLPEAPTFVKGVINMRGNIIPIVDLRERFKLAKTEYGPETAVIIITVQYKTKEVNFGIVVDRVADTYRVNYNEIKPLAENTQSVLREYIMGLVTVKDKMITLLYPKNIISTVTEQQGSLP